jgi:hypothetical protein
MIQLNYYYSFGCTGYSGAPANSGAVNGAANSGALSQSQPQKPSQLINCDAIKKLRN